MKAILIVCVILLCYACQSKNQKKDSVEPDKTPAVESNHSSEPITEEEERFSGLDPEAERYFNNEIRDLHKFDIDYQFPEFEVKYRTLKSNPDTKIIPEKEEVCRGDACQTLKTFKLNDERIVISKFDCGEYGFSNYEYYFKDSVLILYREYSLSAAEFPEENKPTVWEIKDFQYIFSGENATLREKVKLTEELKYDYSLKNKKAKISKLKRSEVEIASPELHEEL